MDSRKVLWSLAVTMLLIAGCSSLPGLRALSGQTTAADQSASQLVEIADLVMADKTGATDPSLYAAAERIEAASGNVDIIEIREALDEDAFEIYMLFTPPAEAASNSQESVVALYQSLRRAVELSWQASLPESEGIDRIRIHMLDPQGIPTLDNGVSFVGVVMLNAEITREDAMLYLSGTRDLATFMDLIVQGTMTFESPETQQLYTGEPNHPLFMLPDLSQQ